MTRPKLEDLPSEGHLAERRLDDGRRKIKLRNRERRDLLRSQRAEEAASLFLDLEHGYSWKEIAEIMDVSMGTLKDVTKSQEFHDAWDGLFVQIGHDPRYQAAKAGIADLLPLSVRELKTMLTSGDTPASVKLRAIFKVIELNGINPADTGVSDRAELAEFLKDNKIINLNFNIPSEFEKELDDLGVVDGEYLNVEENEDIDPALLPSPTEVE